jgi:hypothetical protein
MSNQTLPNVPGHEAPGRSDWLKRAWDAIVGWIRQESAVAQALILAFIAVGIAFGWWQWSSAQIGAVFGILAALLGMFVRSQVTPLSRPMDAGRPLVRAADQPGMDLAQSAGRRGKANGN